MERPETHSEIDGFICIWVKILGCDNKQQLWLVTIALLKEICTRLKSRDAEMELCSGLQVSTGHFLS